MDGKEIAENKPSKKRGNRPAGSDRYGRVPHTFTPQQIAAIEAYAKHGNITQAGIDAGYSTKRIPGNRERAPVARVSAHQALRHLRQNYALGEPIGREQVTEEQVRANLARIRDESRQAGQFGPAIRAEELIGRTVGLWTEKPVLAGEGIEVVIRRRQSDVIDVTPQVFENPAESSA